MLGFILGWRWKIRRLRRKWDRIREKSLKKDEPLRSQLLMKLDDIEQSIRTLEKEKLMRSDRERLVLQVKQELKEINVQMKMGIPENTETLQR